MDVPFLLFAGGIGVLAVAGVWLLGMPLRAARRDGVAMSLGQLIGIYLRAGDPGALVRAASQIRHARGEADVAMLEAHALAGGDVAAVAEAVEVEARSGGQTPLVTLMAMDLGGYDPVRAAASGDAGAWFNAHLLERARRTR